MGIYVDYAWFGSKHSSAVCSCMLSAVKSLCSSKALPAETQTLQIMGQCFLGWDEAASITNLEAKDLAACVAELNVMQQRDLWVMAIIMALCTTQNLQQRLEKLLAAWDDDLFIEKKIKQVIQHLVQGQAEKIQSSAVLDIAYHNNLSQLNGIDYLSREMFKKQMHAMKKGSNVPSLKRKFSFLTELPSHTLGGSLYALLREAKLSLPGEAYGFAEFFLWHDIAHLLSGNNQKFDGELATNAFTAAFSKKAKYSILLFGLLQWNLGIPLAVVAGTAENYLAKPEVMRQYCKSLMVGSETTLDLLHWPTAVMIEDLKMDLHAVRRKYNINLD